MSARAMRQSQIAVEDTAIFRDDSVPCQYPGCGNRILKTDFSLAPTRTPYCETHRCNHLDEDGNRCGHSKVYGSNYCETHAVPQERSVIRFPDSTTLDIQDFASGSEVNDIKNEESIQLTAIQAVELDSTPDEIVASNEAILQSQATYTEKLISEALDFLSTLEDRNETFSSKVSELTKNSPAKLKGHSIDTYGVRFDISVQVSMAIKLLDIFFHDPEIVSSVNEKLGSKRSAGDFHRALYLSILEKWRGNQK